jgi:hypothetical protein
MDDRELDETKNEYEPFEPYIKKEFDKLVDKLFSLNFGINSAPTAPIGEAQKPKLSDVLLEIKQILESPMSNRSAIEAIQELHNKIIKQLNNN